MPNRYPKDIRIILRDMIPDSAKSLLDVGCGSDAKALRVARPDMIVTGIDVERRAIWLSRDKGLDARLLDMRNLRIAFKRNSYDVVLFMDSIEHVPKADADKVLSAAKEIAKMMVLAFVPIGDVGDNPWDKGPHKHRHHWQPEELKELGFDVHILEGYHGGPGRDAMIGTWINKQT